jgi:hypothetical protein
MPLIKQSNKKDFVAVFEDPRAGANTIYLFGDAHNETTLAPIFDSHLKLVAGSGAWNNYGRNNTNDSALSAGAPGYGMALSKQTSHVVHTTQTGDEVRTNVDVSWGLSMDPNNPHSQLKNFTDNVTNMITYYAKSHWFYHIESTYNAIANGTSLSNVSTNYSATTNSDGWNGEWSDYYGIMGLFYRDPTNNFISGLYSRSGGYRQTNPNRPAMGITRINKFPSYVDRANIASRDYCSAQFIGASSVDSRPFYLFNERRNDRTQYIVRHNTDTNTETVINTFNATPSAAGVSYGGDRSTSTGLRNQIKMASRTFVDPSVATTQCFYVPYFDTSNNYVPFLIRWNKLNDTFTRTECTNITGTLSSSLLTNLHGIQGESSGFKSVIANETFVVSGTRYVSVIPLDGGYQVNDAVATARTMVTYSVDAANPAVLTFHSSVTVPSTLKNIVWLNDDRTQLGVITERALVIYNFTTAEGWTVTSTIPYQFWAVGRDSTDRIWGISYNATGYADIHVITASVPLRITITPASATYNYAGSNINSTVNVSAYNLNNERIATSVALSISGNTMTFSGGATTTTVTTSSSGETSVPIVITGAGQSDIVANVQL